MFRDFCVPLPSLNNTERFAPGAVKDARVTTQGIFYAHTSETCQRSHQALRGCTPVDITSLDGVYEFSDRDCSLFLFVPVPWGRRSLP